MASDATNDAMPSDVTSDAMANDATSDAMPSDGNTNAVCSSTHCTWSSATSTGACSDFESDSHLKSDYHFGWTLRKSPSESAIGRRRTAMAMAIVCL